MTHAQPWFAVSSASDAQTLVHGFGGFHDACLREAHLFTEAAVEQSLRMTCPGHLDTRVRLLFQRQSPGPSAVELELSEVEPFVIRPTSDNADSIIYQGTLEWLEGRLVFKAWCVALPLVAEPNSLLTSVERDPAIDIACRQVRWRDASEWMGPALRYGSAARSDA